MLRTRPDSEPSHDVTVPADPIPLSVLELDLPAPVGGWIAYLTGRGIAIMTDDIGRPAITRADARQLFDEQREAEARTREVLERQERQAIEADKQRRAQLPKGLPWYEIPAGVSAAELWAQSEKDSQPRRTTPLEDALAGEGMVYRPLRDEDES